jgi:glycosyltransferase 2 family protein
MEQSRASVAVREPVRRPSDETDLTRPRTRGGGRRWLRIGLQLAVSGGLLAYLFWKIDLGETLSYIRSSNPAYLVAAIAIFIATFWPMAWRWQLLLASKGIHEPLGWLGKLYLIGYSASQVLPTGIGGDAVRILEHARRRPRKKGEAAGAVIMERVVGAAGLLLLASVGLALAVGRYDNIELLIELEAACVAVLVVIAVVVFSSRANAVLHTHVFPRTRAVRLDRALSSVWTALHGYRSQKRTLAMTVALTVGVQFVRTITIWLCGEAVGIDVSLLVYVILGPLLFLVTMVPITINGLGVRESFFVFFLGRFGVGADEAFAAGFLFFTVTIAAAIPGALILAWRSIRGGLLAPGRRERAPAETS